MYIQLSMQAENKEAVLAEGLHCINQAARDDPQWQKNARHDYYEAKCEISEEELLAIFQRLTEKYPALEISATFVQDIREEDRSAQWWRTTTVKTEHRPEGTALCVDSSTHWF